MTIWNRELEWRFGDKARFGALNTVLISIKLKKKNYKRKQLNNKEQKRTSFILLNMFFSFYLEDFIAVLGIEIAKSLKKNDFRSSRVSGKNWQESKDEK